MTSPASTASLLPLGEWTLPYKEFRQINTDGCVDAHPTSTSTACLGWFLCRGCDIERTVTVVTKSDLNEDSEQLGPMYPWMLTSTKICAVENNHPTKQTSTIVGYVCQDCASFYYLTKLFIRVTMEDRPPQLLKIERLFTVSKNPSLDTNPLTYLRHLENDPTYQELFELKENLLQIIEKNPVIDTLPRLVQYAREQTISSS